MPEKKTTSKKPAAEEKAQPIKLNREQREKLIQIWRHFGWPYAKIVAKFESGVTQEEYDNYIEKFAE